MQVLEDEGQRLLLRKARQELSPRSECFGSPVPHGVPRLTQADQRPQVVGDPVVVDRGEQLALRHVGGVALEDPEVDLHYLTQRPERHTVAVRQAATLPPQESTVADDELVHEPALADPGCTDQGHELRDALLAGTGQSRAKKLEFGLAADEGHGVCPLGGR